MNTSAYLTKCYKKIIKCSYMLQLKKLLFFLCLKAWRSLRIFCTLLHVFSISGFFFHKHSPSANFLFPNDHNELVPVVIFIERDHWEVRKKYIFYCIHHGFPHFKMAKVQQLTIAFPVYDFVQCLWPIVVAKCSLLFWPQKLATAIAITLASFCGQIFLPLVIWAYQGISSAATSSQECHVCNQSACSSCPVPHNCGYCCMLMISCIWITSLAILQEQNSSSVTSSRAHAVWWTIWGRATGNFLYLPGLPTNRQYFLNHCIWKKRRLER